MLNDCKHLTDIYTIKNFCNKFAMICPNKIKSCQKYEKIGDKMNDTKQKCFISGPMSGHENWNFAAFLDAEQKLSHLGYEFISAARVFANADPENLPSWEECMDKMMVELEKAHIVCVIPGWHKSKGAKIEIKRAQELGIKVYLLDTLITLKEWEAELHDITSLDF